MPTIRPGDIVRIRDERWTVCRHVAHSDAAVIEVRGCDRTNRGTSARFVLPFELHDRLPPVRATRTVSRRRWRHLARQALAAATPACDSLRALASARIDIHPFQLEPAVAVVRGAAARLLLADAVGLGKTIQAGLIVSEVLARASDARALVVCPASLRDQWSSEFEQRFGLRPVLLDSAAITRSSARAMPGANPWTAHTLVVASVDFVKRAEVLRALEGAIWDVVVVDEAHALTGRSDRHAAATLLGERARTLVMLTATPHPGHEDGFRRLCSIGDLRPHFPLAVFHRTRDDVGLAASRRTTWLVVAPTPAERRMHDALLSYAGVVRRQKGGPSAEARLAMLVLLRRAGSSASSLARSIERRIQLLAMPSGHDDEATQLALPFDASGADDAEPARELAAPGLDDAGVERQMLHEILGLARRASHAESKVRVIRRYLRRTGEPAIVFTEYRDTLAMLAQRLADFDCCELHGGCTAGERQQVLRRFAAGPTRVLLATDAASEGLNLQQRCRLVIHLDVPWTPMRTEQRVGRVDRIGQRRRVHQVHLVAARTPEHTMVAPLVRRRAAQARKTMDAMRLIASTEAEIGERLFGPIVAPPGNRRAGRDIPDGTIVVDFHDLAVEEASRATAARARGGTSGAGAHPSRPFGTALQRHCARGIWVFRVDVADSEDEVLWETVLGVTYAVSRRRLRTAGSVSAHLDMARVRLLPLVLRHRNALAARVAAALAPSIALGVAREQAILAAIDAHHARLAASLVQPALFDRRAERARAAQQEIFADVAARCHAHLARLSRRRQPLAREPEPAFAVIGAEPWAT